MKGAEGVFKPHEQAGVGIVFKPSFHNETFMALVVHDLVRGSSPEVLGSIQRGDMLQSIDGIDVFKRPAQEVSDLLLGLVGTMVKIGLFRELVSNALQKFAAFYICIFGFEKLTDQYSGSLLSCSSLLPLPRHASSMQSVQTKETVQIQPYPNHLLTKDSKYFRQYVDSWHHKYAVFIFLVHTIWT